MHRRVFAIITIMTLTMGCQTLQRKVFQTTPKRTLLLPQIKNSAQECYFLDDFMPMPNTLVTGRSGSMRLRYYTYQTATYKDWPEGPVMLSFYSYDESCWTLYEELSL